MNRKAKKAKTSARFPRGRHQPRRGGLPFLFVNFAITADGKIAFANRKFAPFGSARDREHMMELRATADAVMSGARTVDSGEVSLGPGGEKYRRLRIRRGLSEYNLRVIVSGSGSIDPKAHIFTKRFSPVIILTTQRAGKQIEKLRAVADDVKICGANEIDFREALLWLREKWNVKRLLCEGGGELNVALFRARLVDELHLTICPTIFGGNTAPTLADGTGNATLADAAPLALSSSKRIGDEMLLVYRAIER
ncbi:MAG TPA: dihydrofolate reductase family protein [Verrucomicrobiae bacterium]|nr:dihydrofolate reductase family protein [Verrucomicrobiae bacterium]